MQGFSSRHLRRLAANEKNEILNQRSYIDSDENDSTSQDSYDSQESNPLETKPMDESDEGTDMEDITSLQIKLRDWYLAYKPPKNCVENLLRILKSENVDVPTTIKGLLEIGNERAAKRLVKRELISGNIEQNEEPIISLLLAEVRSLRQELVDRDEPYKKMMGRLTAEVITLRNEIRQLKKTTSLFGESSTNLLPNLPLNSMEDLHKFDIDLHKNAEMVSQLQLELLKLGGDDLPRFIRSAARKIITDELAMQFSWTGTVTKPSIQNHYFVTAIRDKLTIDQRLQNIETNQKRIMKNQSKLKHIVLQMQEESLHLQSQILAILNQTVKKNNKTIIVQHVEFPITTLEQLRSIDEKIKADMESYIQKIKLIIAPEGLRRNIHRIISKEVILKCNYDGGYNNTSLKKFHGLTTAMYEAVKEEGYSEMDFVKDLRSCVRCVKGRHYKDLCIKRKKLNNYDITM